MFSRSGLLCPVVALVLSASAAFADTTLDSIAKIAGHWDLPGSRTSIEIRPNKTVQHWSLGVGTIEHEIASFYVVTYQQHAISCRYEIKRYSDDELSVIVATRPAPDDCELGILRRAPDDKDASGPADASREKASEQRDDAADKAIAGKGAPFKDCEACPEMVVAPAGSFLMGSPLDEPGRKEHEGPQRRVVFPKPFAAGRFPVTVDEFKTFVTETGHRMVDVCGTGRGAPGSFEAPPGFDPGFVQTGRHPAVCISWHDAKAYVAWLSAKTKQPYRLLSEAEREYITRAGTTTPYWWGAGITPAQALYDTRPMPSATPPPAGPKKTQKKDAKTKANQVEPAPSAADLPPPGRTAVVDQYRANDWGYYQVHGNVGDWTEDCWTASIGSSSDSGAPVLNPNCEFRVLRGGSWSYWPTALRSAHREAAAPDRRYNDVGFRVAREMQ